jgi:cation diffusion facilitator CzcD-associated flavoprotein CzcO
MSTGTPPVDDELAGFDPEWLRAKYRAERDKRIRRDGNRQYVEVADRLAAYGADPFSEPVEREPQNLATDVLLIGGGFATLVAAARLRAVGVDDITFVDTAGGFGGTWYWNRYPGAQCDVDAYIYLPLLEEIGYMPERKYAFGPEIRQHAERIAEHFDLGRSALFGTAVTRMTWQGDEQRWLVKTDRGDEISARFVAMAPGPLNRPKLPGIPGIENYQGHAFHTSRWDYSYTSGDESGSLDKLRDLSVGVVGTGSTAIQCIPHLAKHAGSLRVFQRTPAAVDWRRDRETDASWAASLQLGWHQERMNNFTKLTTGIDQEIDLVDDGWTELFPRLTGIAAAKEARRLGRRLTREEKDELLFRNDYLIMERIRRRVADVVEDATVAEKLMPWYRRLCKRPQFHDTYLQAFNQPNVQLVDTDGKGIDSFTARGPVVNGVEHPVDLMIFATGFEVGTAYVRRLGFDVIGRQGQRLSDKWSEGLRTFYGMQTHGFPNCFFLGQTQTGMTFNYTHTVTEQAGHVAHLIQETQKRGASSIDADQEAEDAWVEEMRRYARLGEDFYLECTPGFLNSEGEIRNPFGLNDAAYGPGPIAFFELLETWRNEGSERGVTYA